MAVSNHQRVRKALDLLKDGLGPFVAREIKKAVESGRLDGYKLRNYVEDPSLGKKPITEWDAAGLLKLMWGTWHEVFRFILGRAERSLISELREYRNNWAHQESFLSEDAYRVADSAERLLTAVSAPEAEELNRFKKELRRVLFEEQVRGELRRKAGAVIESASATNLEPWRNVVTPHTDVSGGSYQTAEFAADLWQVHLGEGSNEYQDPEQFFRLTYPTESLKRLLAGAVKRLGGGGGDPVVQLQTNFGGGKTHSMLALYHLFSGVNPAELEDVEEVMRKAGAAKLPGVRRVVLVGSKISPGRPDVKDDGTEVRTLWGELAWQLGGKEAYARIAADDEKATNPGDVLRELFDEYGPCLILIDEWVAYARQLHDENDLPAGSFDTQFTFAQALTESAKLAGRCLLVVSLPASDTSGSPYSGVEDEEVGGRRGREALDRLRNIVGRIESSWRPASAEESFEIVRRRLFEPFSDSDKFKKRDVTARAFAELYRTQSKEFPPECRETDYEKRIKAAYPIHPEIFDRLYTDWSTLVKFQRTRGVLRLMAAVIHNLWEKGDKSPLILPANIAIDDSQVHSELTRYLSDSWLSVIDKDVDGLGSLPLRIDGEVANLGKFTACRRVSRTIFLGSAPIENAAHKGIEDSRVKLGCVMPGESPAIFGDALRRLAASATYLYQDGPRCWYSTLPSITKMAEERAARLEDKPEKVRRELDKRLRADLKDQDCFSRVHILPQSAQDVLDDLDARLVVLGINHPCSKQPGSEAELAAKDILENRGSIPRIFRNTLVFLAPDAVRLKDLDKALRYYLAWDSIWAERESLNLSQHESKQAERRRDAASNAVSARIPETYMWLLVPKQENAGAAVEWEFVSHSGRDKLAVRACRKLRSKELLITRFAPTRLRMELDNVPLWRGDYVSVKQLLEDFAKYPYLPRMSEPRVLLEAIGEGVALLTWENDAFAFADSYDDAAGRFCGLRSGQVAALPDADAPGLLVKPDAARRQFDAEIKTEPGGADGTGAGKPGGADTNGSTGPNAEGDPGPTPKPVQPKRFYGTAVLDTQRVGRDAGRIAEEVIAHMSGIPGAKVTVSLEIEADIPSGAPEHVVRTVTENSRTLKFTNQGFEKE